MTESTGDRVAALAAEAWQPHSLRASPGIWPTLRWRVAILCGVIVLHALVGRYLLGLMTRENPPEEVITVLEFLAPPVLADSLAIPEPATELPTHPPPAERPRPASVELPPATPVPPRKRPVPRSMAIQALPPSIDDAQPLYDAEGRVRVPDDLLDQIDRKLGDKRIFSYQVPRMDDAKKLFYRNPPITYQKSVFDEYWKPDADLLTELLTRAVEKTTREVRIPVPGQPGSTMVCHLSLLALGGSCGVLTNGADYVGPVDDPDTLSPVEDRQCQAWWNRIVGATTQDVWRKTRDLYEAECRKPLLRQ